MEKMDSWVDFLQEQRGDLVVGLMQETKSGTPFATPPFKSVSTKAEGKGGKAGGTAVIFPGRLVGVSSELSVPQAKMNASRSVFATSFHSLVKDCASASHAFTSVYFTSGLSKADNDTAITSLIEFVRLADGANGAPISIVAGTSTCSPLTTTWSD